MKTYTVKAGQTNFRPLESPLPVLGAKGFKVDGRFLPGGWCSLEDYEGDQDYFDWMKLKGLSHFFSANNKRTAMFAFRFGPEPGTYELTAYTNSKDYSKGWIASGSMIVREGQTFSLECEMQRRNVVYTASIAGVVAFEVTHTLKRPRITRKMGTYMGGADNSPGPHGGEALKGLSVQLQLTVLR